MTFWKQALNKAQDFLTDHEVRERAAIGGRLHQVAAQIGQAHLAGPIGMARHG